jgi:hypothetical protein
VRVNSGEPYDSDPVAQSIVTQIAQYHSAYYLLDGAYGVPKEAPAPLLIANGFTDDLFPVDEAVRYYNLERSLYPNNPIALIDGDFGHMRAQNKSADKALLSSGIQAYFDQYVKGGGTSAPSGATAVVETCPQSAASGPTYIADSWAALHPGEVDYSSSNSQTVLSAGGDPTISKTFGVATYRLPAVTGSGYTLLGSPTVIANLQVTGTFPELALRLLDVDPSTGTETLVARGVYRPNASGQQVFQLHPGAWHFAAGHIPKLELLGRDAPYVRASNGVFSISVSNLQLRLPVHEQPGSAPGVTMPLPPVSTSGSGGGSGGGAGCAAKPSSKIAKRRTRTSHKRLLVQGTASPSGCAGAGVAHVYVVVYRKVHGRCRFLRRNGTLSRARSCRRPLELRAGGVARWKLRLRLRVPAGRYVILSDAVESNNAHQARGRSSTQTIRIR